MGFKQPENIMVTAECQTIIERHKSKQFKKWRYFDKQLILLPDGADLPTVRFLSQWCNDFKGFTTKAKND